VTDCLRLLVVEDDADLRAMLVEVFLLAGFSVHSAGDMSEALEHAERQDFDVVWMDIMLPGAYGWDCAQVLIDTGCKAFFIATSGSTVCLEQAERLGLFSKLVPKPYESVAALGDVVQEVMLPRSP
jgi:CheY-like chemotaxis protein